MLFISLLPSCSEQSQKTIETNKLNQFECLVGKWYNHSPDGDFFENWVKTNDTVFSGNSCFVSGEDTLFSEKMTLELKGTEVFYVVSVNNQNQGKAVLFKLISDSNKVFVFENKLHDFPQRIIYTNPLPDSLYARFEGIKNENNHFEEFSFNRCVKTK